MKVTVTHISTVKILKMVKDTTNITIAIKYEVMYWFSIVIFIFDLREIG